MEDKVAYYMNILNIFIKHYNRCNETNINMFTGVDTLDGTNDMMEEFYEHLTEFKESGEDDKRLYAYEDIDADDFEQLYGLGVNGNLICVCRILIPIIEYISKEVDWVQVKWQIIPLKMN